MRRFFLSFIVFLSIFSNPFNVLAEKSFETSEKVIPVQRLPSGVKLAERLYEKGVALERSGNLVGAYRLWTLAANLDPASQSIFRRAEDVRNVINRLFEDEYGRVLLDMEAGRVVRSRSILLHLKDFVRDFDSELLEKVDTAIAKIDLMMRD